MSGSVHAWHASPALLVAYAGGRSGPVDSASLEAHLVACAVCRAELNLVLDPADVAVLDAVRPRVTARTPHRRPMPAAIRVLAPSAMVAAALLSVGVAFALDAISTRGGSILPALAPAVPLAGVAWCASRPGDACAEAVLATASSGLRLTLWRTLIVLAIAVPLTALAGVAADAGTPVIWLLPSAALTTLSLALGTVVDLPRATAGVGLVWCAAVLGPLVLPDPPLTSVLVTTAVQPVWLVVAGAAAVALGRRHTAYDWLPR